MNNGNEIRLMVNGQEYCVAEKPGEMLSDLLRYRLGLTGTKIGCNEAECGACTVLVDGQPVLSCNFPAAKANDREILTIEGLATPGEKPDQAILHPLQDAFVRYGAVQCGFCIPGQIMTAYALLRDRPEASEGEIRYALKDTLCRCGGYTAIIDAIQAAGKAIRTGQPVEGPANLESSRPGKVVGRAAPRPDAVEKTTGAALYTDDLSFAGMLHARVKRALVPSAIVRKVDVSKAAELPGVRAVLVAEDIPGETNHGLVIFDWPAMVGVGGRVRTVGDALAIVAADTREIATQALDLIEVELEPLPVVSDPVQAKRADAPQIHESGNLLKHIKVRKGDVEEGFKHADIILEHTFHTPMHDHAFLEPECSIAVPRPDDGRMEIYVGSQIPYSDRSQVARALGWPEERVHIIGMLVGGGFGGKEDIAGQIHAALLAQKTGRAVKLLFDRQESLIAHPKRHATQIRVKVGAKNDGRLVAVESELYGDSGAYASLGEKVMTRATTHSSGPYEAPHVKADCYAMYTNNPPAGAFRGFGVFQSAFAVESTMDMLAERLGMDPVELRRMNALRVGSITNTGQKLRASVGLQECIDQVEKEMRRLGGPRPFDPKTQPGVDAVRAWGFAVAYKNTGLGGGAPDKAGAEVELYPDGKLQVRSASAELGQGLPTVLRLIAAEELNQPPEKVNVLLMDTDLTPDGGPTTASRQTYVTGNAVRHASAALAELITSHLSEHFDIPPEEVRFVEGLAQVGERSIPMAQVAEIMLADGRKPMSSYTYWAPATKPLGQGGDMHVAFSFAAQAAEVEVNRRTGEVKVLRVLTANDVGFAVNPLGLQGQIEGGVMMGIGHALTEGLLLDQGRVITDRLARYRIPSITMTPRITSFVVEHPSEDGPYGAKGVGEIVIIPTAPAITNAIYNATGVRVDSLPVDQEKIARAMLKF